MRTQFRRYLDDHLAGSFAAEHIVQHMLGKKEVPAEWQGWMRRFLDELAEDRAEVMRVQHALGFKTNRLKLLGGRVMGLASRLGTTEKLAAYTPFTLFLELEALSLGIEGKRALWTALQRLQPEDARLSNFDFNELERRATAQRRTVERYRKQTAVGAFTESPHASYRAEVRA